MANLLRWLFRSRWVPTASYDALEKSHDSLIRLFREQANENDSLRFALSKEKSTHERLRKSTESFRGKVAIGPEYHRKVARLLSVACQLLDSPMNKSLASQLARVAMELQSAEVVVAPDRSMNG